MTQRQFGQRGAGARCNGVKDAEQGITVSVHAGVTKTVAGDQFRKIEIIAGIHAHAFAVDAARAGQLTTHGDFLIFAEQGNFDAVYFIGVRVDDADGRVHGLFGIVRSPVAFQGRVERITQPVQYDGLSRLAQDAVIDVFIIRRALGHARQRPAGHDDKCAAEFLNRLHLLFIAGNDLVDGADIFEHKMIRATTRSEQGARHIFGGVQ